jgi:hypothetical protein
MSNLVLILKWLFKTQKYKKRICDTVINFANQKSTRNDLVQLTPLGIPQIMINEIDTKTKCRQLSKFT